MPRADVALAEAKQLSVRDPAVNVAGGPLVRAQRREEPRLLRAREAHRELAQHLDQLVVAERASSETIRREEARAKPTEPRAPRRGIGAHRQRQLLRNVSLRAVPVADVREQKVDELRVRDPAVGVDVERRKQPIELVRADRDARFREDARELKAVEVPIAVHVRRPEQPTQLADEPASLGGRPLLHQSKQSLGERRFDHEPRSRVHVVARITLDPSSAIIAAAAVPPFITPICGIPSPSSSSPTTSLVLGLKLTATVRARARVVRLHTTRAAFAAPTDDERDEFGPIDTPVARLIQNTQETRCVGVTQRVRKPYHRERA